MNTEHKKRLLKLASILENFKTARRKLRLPHHPQADLQNLEFNLVGWGSINCHSVACAVGTACLHPYFNNRGLAARLVYNSPLFTITPVYGFDKDWDAAQAFFGLTIDEACRLFEVGEYPARDRTRPATVARRIRQFVKMKAKK